MFTLDQVNYFALSLRFRCHGNSLDVLKIVFVMSETAPSLIRNIRDIRLYKNDMG
jgi:hypothetical protein